MSDESTINKQIKNAIKQIIDLISNSKTIEEGLKKYNKLVTDNISTKDKLTFIIHSISEYITKSPSNRAKESSLILLPEFFRIFPSIKSTYPFISRILTTIQSNISSIELSSISSTFDSITKILFVNSSLEDKEDKHNFELFQGFCYYNMKQKEYSEQQCGGACLNVLISTCSYFLTEKHIRNIWGKTIDFIESNDFRSKLVLLKCLITLISNVKEGFRSYAVATLFKIIDLLSESDADIRNEALNVIYLLVSYCKEDIDSLKDQIIEFLEVLSNDQDDNIRKKCLLILKEYDIYIDDSVRLDKSNNNVIRSQMSDDHSHNKGRSNDIIIAKGKKMRKDNIFTTCRNDEFFQRAKSQNEILVVDYTSPNSNSNNYPHQHHSIIPISISINQSQNEYHSQSANKKMSSNMKMNLMNRGEFHHREEHENYVINTNPNKEDNPNNKRGGKNQDEASLLTQNYFQLISQMKTLSHNQVCLLDTVTDIISDYNLNVEKLTSRVSKLETIYEKRLTHSEHQSLKDALDNKDDEALGDIVNELSLKEIKEIDHGIIEQMIDRLLIDDTNDYWERTDLIPQMKITIMKKLLIGTKIELNSTAVDCLQEKLQNILQGYKDELTHDDVIDVKLIQAYLSNAFLG